MKFFSTLTKTNIKLISCLKKSYRNATRKRKVPYQEVRSNAEITIIKSGYMHQFLGKTDGSIVKVIQNKSSHKYHEVLVSRSTIIDKQFQAIADIFHDSKNDRLYVISKGAELRVLSLNDTCVNAKLIGILNYEGDFLDKNGDQKYMVLVYADKGNENILNCLFNDGSYCKLELTQSNAVQLTLWQRALSSIYSLIWKSQVSDGLSVLSRFTDNDLNIFKAFKIDAESIQHIEKTLYTSFGSVLVIQENINKKKVNLLYKLILC